MSVDYEKIANLLITIDVHKDVLDSIDKLVAEDELLDVMQKMAARVFISQLKKRPKRHLKETLIYMLECLNEKSWVEIGYSADLPSFDGDRVYCMDQLLSLLQVSVSDIIQDYEKKQTELLSPDWSKKEPKEV